MRKILFGVSPIGVAILVVLTIAIPQRSEALGSESLGCFVAAGVTGQFHSPGCAAARPRSSYVVTFKVLNGSGGYSYSWDTHGLGDCTSSTDSCSLSVSGITDDQTLRVSVVITQGGQSSTLTATAFIPAVCFGYDGSPEFC